MFESLAIAHEIIARSFEAPQAAIVEKALIPTISLYPIEAGKIAIGGSRLGGAPDGPKDFTWPSLPEPADAEDLVSRAAAETGEEIRAHLAKKLPLAFVAQIDLAAAGTLGEAAKGLPENGRLLFFYDFATGPWNTGMETARVVWDRTAPGEIGMVPQPDPLATAIEEERKGRIALADEFGSELDDPNGIGNIYGAPPRAVELRETYRLPVPEALEIERIPELSARLSSQENGTEEDFGELYREVLEENHGRYTRETWRRQQVLGSPEPEQDDPRYDAVVVTEFGKQHRETVGRKAREWRLLLQLDVADWMQDPLGTGTVYFLIREDDLKAGRFDHVVGVYQQT